MDESKMMTPKINQSIDQSINQSNKSDMNLNVLPSGK